MYTLTTSIHPEHIRALCARDARGRFGEAINAGFGRGAGQDIKEIPMGRLSQRR